MVSMYRMNKTTQARRRQRTQAAARHTEVHARPGERAAGAGGGRRIQVRRSGVHGKGMFALVPIAQGERIIEYIGEVITWAAAQKRHPHDPSDPNHTFFFHIDDKHVIDGARRGNSARWINHSCEPNCQAEEEDGRIFVDALRDIAPGEELFYDYGLIVDERHTPALKKQYACRCGSTHCRRTMLGRKR